MTAKEIAIEAAGQITKAISKVNHDYPKAFIKWPLDLVILNDGISYQFDFCELLEEYDRKKSAT